MHINIIATLVHTLNYIFYRCFLHSKQQNAQEINAKLSTGQMFGWIWTVSHIRNSNRTVAVPFALVQQCQHCHMERENKQVENGKGHNGSQNEDTPRMTCH